MTYNMSSGTLNPTIHTMQIFLGYSLWECKFSEGVDLGTFDTTWSNFVKEDSLNKDWKKKKRHEDLEHGVVS